MELHKFEATFCVTEVQQSIGNLHTCTCTQRHVCNLLEKFVEQFPIEIKSNTYTTGIECQLSKIELIRVPIS